LKKGDNFKCVLKGIGGGGGGWACSGLSYSRGRS